MAQTKPKAAQFFGVIGHGTDGYFLMTNADGTMSWSEVATVINPTITSVDYPGAATAADPAGSESITINGTGFATGASVTIGGTAAGSVSFVSATELTVTTPAKTAGDYDIVVTNTDGGSATSVNGISYNGIPAWTTAAGSLGTFASDTTISTITLQATEPDAGTITFSITNGTLPTGLSLSGADIDGTTTLETSDTLYTFTVTATDDESQTTPRTFTITVTKQFISTDNFTINTYAGTSSTQSIEGKIGTAADFNGLQTSSASYIDISSSITNPNSSISMWINTTNKDANFGNIFDAGGGSSGNTGFAIMMNPTSGYLRVNFTDGTSGSIQNFSGTTDIADGNWHHIVLSMASDNTFILYLDGASHITGTRTRFTQTDSHNLSISRFGTNAGSVGASSYDGKIDQVRVFNKALSSSEVTTLYGESNTSTTKSTTDVFDDSSGIALYEFEKGAIDTGGVTGYIGSGGIFNGSSSSIVATNFPITGNSARSYSAWVYTNGSTTGAVCGIGDHGVAGQSMYLWIDQTNSGRWSLWGFTATYDIENASLPALASLSNGWHHFALTWDASSTFKLYIDGSLADTKTKSVTYNTPGIFAIGRWYDSGYWFNSKIDQVRVFNKALSSSEITTLYGETSASATKSTTDIFDDSSGVALYELEGNANDTGRGFGQSAVFNGSTSNINFGNVLNTTFENNWSVSAWINFNSGTSGAILQKGPNILNGEYIRLYTRSSTPRIQFGYSDGSTNGVDMSTNSYDPGGKGWVHVVGTADYSGSFKLYVDGSLVETQNVTGGAPSFSMTDPLYIGYNGGGGGYVDGNIDDVRLYSSVLTSTDVEYLYKNDISNIPTANLASHWKLDGNANDSIGSINGTETDITYNDGVAYNGTSTNVTYAYDGTPTNVSFVGTAFQPDFVWLRSRTQVDNHYLQDAVRGATRRLHSNLTVAEQSPDSNRFTSFDSNGFTVGGDNSVNMTGHDYVAWCWKAASSDSTNTNGTITSTVRANQDAGFSIVKWTGTNAINTIGHGLSSAPELILIKSLDVGADWQVYAEPIGNNNKLALNLTSAASSSTRFDSTSPTSSVFTFRDVGITGDQIAYCFHSVDEYQKVGSYTSNASVKISTGFEPRFLMIKYYGTTSNWWMMDTQRYGNETGLNGGKLVKPYLEANTSDAEASVSSGAVEIMSDGFYPTNFFNSNGVIYLAIA